MDPHGVFFQRGLTPEHLVAKTASEIRLDIGTRQQVSGQVRFVLERFRTALAHVLGGDAALFSQMPHEVVPLFVAPAARVRTEVPFACRENWKQIVNRKNKKTSDDDSTSMYRRWWVVDNNAVYGASVKKFKRPQRNDYYSC